MAGYLCIGREIGVKVNPEQDRRRCWITSRTYWLIVFLDEANEKEQLLGKAGSPGLVEYLSRSNHGQILITTRDSRVVGLADGQVVPGEMASALVLFYITKASSSSINLFRTTLFKILRSKKSCHLLKCLVDCPGNCTGIGIHSRGGVSICEFTLDVNSNKLTSLVLTQVPGNLSELRLALQSVSSCVASSEATMLLLILKPREVLDS